MKELYEEVEDCKALVERMMLEFKILEAEKNVGTATPTVHNPSKMSKRASRGINLKIVQKELKSLPAWPKKTQ